MKRVGWKIVFTKNKIKVSSIVSGSGKVIYKFNKWVVPHRWGGPLCVFNNRRNARYYSSRRAGWRRYSRANGKYQIYKCEYCEQTWKSDEIPSVWVRPFSSSPSKNLPFGTRLASHVKLLNRRG